MSVSWRKRKRERAGEKKENENSCSSSTYAPFLKQNLPARLLQPLPIHWHIRTKTHTVKCTTHHESQEAQCTMVTFLTWSSPAVSVTLDTHRPWKLVRARINRYCNRLLSHGWFNKAIMTITVCCSCIYNRKQGQLGKKEELQIFLFLTKRSLI